MQHAIDDSPRSTCNVTRCDVRQATDSERHAIGDTGAGNRKQTTCSRHMQRAPGEMQQTTRPVQHTTSLQHASCSGQYAANNNGVQRARQHATCSMQLTTDHVEKTTDGVQRTQTTRQETTRQHAGLQQTTGNGQHATDNVHQTADGMQEDTSTCEMQQRTHGTAAVRVRRAAGSAQSAACAKHCPPQPMCATRHRQHATRAAACSKLT